MLYLLLFHCNNFCMNAPQGYVMRILSVLFTLTRGGEFAAVSLWERTKCKVIVSLDTNGVSLRNDCIKYVISHKTRHSNIYMNFPRYSKLLCTQKELCSVVMCTLNVMQTVERNTAFSKTVWHDIIIERILVFITSVFACRVVVANDTWQ